MGYTHYWRFNSSRGNTQHVEGLYQKAITDCARIIKYYQKNELNKANRLSGYSAHTALGQYGGIKFNGKASLAHEDFVLREHYNENDVFGFCKTAYKPYDLVVTACLAALKYRLGDFIEVSSDGGLADWIGGVELAKKTLKRQVKMPMSFERSA